MPCRKGRTLLACRIALVSSIVLPHMATAVNIERAEIRFDDNTYHYVFETVIEANADRVRDVVSRFDQLHELNDSIVDSRVLERYGSGDLKRLLALRQCVLRICFDLRFVERVQEHGDGFTTTVIPAESTFRDGVAEWRLNAVSTNRTRLTISAAQTPDFWIPPVIGPFLLERVFLSEVAETCMNIERLAAGTLRAP